MEEDFTAQDIAYINEPFSKRDLKYIKKVNQEKFWFFYNLNLQKMENNIKEAISLLALNSNKSFNQIEDFIFKSNNEERKTKEWVKISGLTEDDVILNKLHNIFLEVTEWEYKLNEQPNFIKDDFLSRFKKDRLKSWEEKAYQNLKDWVKLAHWFVSFLKENLSK